MTQGLFYDILVLDITITKRVRAMNQRKTSLYFPIVWSMIAMWWTYRFFANLPQIGEQPRWITVGDILALICYYALAISYWIIFTKSRKQGDSSDGQRWKLEYKSMKNSVTVRKCRSHRIFIYIFTAIMTAVITAMVFLWHTASALIFYVPVLIIAVPMTLYFATWQIQFGPSRIEKKVFFRKTKSYSYAELREVVKGYYISERDYCIRMHFADGKKL